MLLDYFHRSKHSRKRSKKDPPNDSPVGVGTATRDAVGGNVQAHSGGFFNNASGLTVNNSNSSFTDLSNARIGQITVVQNIVDGSAVIKLLLPFICEGALVDSSDRVPPPRCHEGTREKIQNLLIQWLESQLRPWKIIWLYGPAGTGKSAVAQTFAEHCASQYRLGAAFFFSRANGRNDPKTVVPTIAYQLGVACAGYKAIIAEIIANDPLVLKKSPRAQFTDLIAAPFLKLKKQDHQVTQEPLVIILDGLDECAGMDEQCEFIEVIREAMTMKDLPLLWFIVGRPEPHLTYMFTRVDFPVKCDKHQLRIDANTRKDVQHYIRGRLNEIGAKFLYAGEGTWPSLDHFKRLVEIADGLFALATAMLNYIGDATFANPAQRLLDLLAFIKRADALAVDNPLKTLDLLYSRILADVPPSILPVTKLMLYLTFGPYSGMRPTDALGLASFARLDQTMYYVAVRHLHAVIDVPPPGEAANRLPKMYHTSFKDYLTNYHRSGSFCLGTSEETAFWKLILFWCQIIWNSYASDDALVWTSNDQPSILSELRWTPADDAGRLAGQINAYAHSNWHLFTYMYHTPLADPGGFLPLFEEFDFRYMPFKANTSDLKMANFLNFINWLFESQQEKSVLPSLLRTEPTSELDKTLVASVIHTSMYAFEPASFPLVSRREWDSLAWRYFFLGREEKTCLFFADLDREVIKLGRSRLSCKAQSGGRYAVDDCVVHGPVRLLTNDQLRLEYRM